MDGLKDGVKKGAWSSVEDELLTHYVQLHGERKWRSLAQKAGLNRSGKSCRLRWLNYLRPGIKRGDFSADEDELIIKLHRLLGNRWALIAGRLPGRTDNEVKNYWNTILVKKLQGQKSDSGSSTRKFQAEDRKDLQDFSWRELQEIPGQAIEANKVQVHGNVDDGQSSSPSFMQIDQDDNSFLSSMDAFNPDNFFISDNMEFDSFQEKCDDKAPLQFENGDQTDPLQRMELKKIASLLDIENELRELL